VIKEAYVCIEIRILEFHTVPIPRPEESYRLWCVSECDQVRITQPRRLLRVGRRGKDYDDDDDDDDDDYDEFHTSSPTHFVKICNFAFKIL
jgi:hypothetical protein